MGLVIGRTEVVYLKSLTCVIVKKTFQVTCRVASFQIQKMKLILFCRVPASSRRQKLSMILQIAPCLKKDRCITRSEHKQYFNESYVEFSTVNYFALTLLIIFNPMRFTI